MNTFETSLLTELREHVATRAAAEPTPSRRPKRVRWSVVPAGAAATAIALVLVQSPAAAYAVDSSPNGDITITIHRLDDAAGLESDLAEHGIKADVNYDDTSFTHVGGPALGGAGQPVGPGGSTQSFDSHSGTSSSPSTVRGSAESPTRGNDACGGPTHFPLTTTMRSDEYVITIPEDSALHRADSELKITTSGNLKDSVAGITVNFTVDGVTCGLGTMSARMVPVG